MDDGMRALQRGRQRVAVERPPHDRDLDPARLEIGDDVATNKT